MNLCITGGAGFIGSYFLEQALKEIEEASGKIIVYDALTYAGETDCLNHLDSDRFIFIRGDINDRMLFRETLEKYEISHIVHFAAETHVDRSIQGDSIFLKTNVEGTWSVVTTAAEYWTANGGYTGKKFLHISTDEVYGVTTAPADENTALSPSNPYAASKAAADQYVLMRRRFDGFPAVVARSSNNFGFRQHPEKLIPKIAHCLEGNHPIPIYGDGKQKRCWLYAKDYAEILWALLTRNVSESVYNVRGSQNLENGQLAELMRNAYAKSKGISLEKVSPILFVEDRKGHDRFYNIDHSRLKSILPDFEGVKIETFLRNYFNKQ